MFSQPKRQDGDPETKAEWTPPIDPVFQYLLQEALFGNLPVYFAAVPLGRVLRFEPTFRPEGGPNGEMIVAAIMQNCREGQFKQLWVYPKGDTFIASDDYFTLAAAERGQPDFVPCWVLGIPSPAAAKDVQGPIEQKALRKMFGFD